MYQNDGDDFSETQIEFEEHNSRSMRLKRVVLYVCMGVLTSGLVFVLAAGSARSSLMRFHSDSTHADVPGSKKSVGNWITSILKLPPPPPLEIHGKITAKMPASSGSVFLPAPAPSVVSLEKLAHKSEEEKKGLFAQFKSAHFKKYSNPKEESERYEVFKENLSKIDELNSKAVHAKFSHTSKFADLTDEEFKIRNGLRSDYSSRIQTILGLSDDKKAKLGFIDFANTGVGGRMKQASKVLPTTFDWRSYGAVTPVKDQGECGGCWAFAATGDMEGTWKQQTGSLVSLSEQELISCATEADGCSGGMMNEAYQFVISNNGISTETQYPYQSGLTQSDGMCQLPSSSPVTITGWTMIKSTTAADLQAALKSEGPIAVGINANQMQFYSSGIDVCTSQDPINHAVLLVGYGNSDGEEYWIIKNSWGISWGQQGYYYISTAKGACGVQTVPMKSLYD